MQFKIVTESDYDYNSTVEKLNTTAGELVSQGWIPIGGISVTARELTYETVFYASLILVHPEESKLLLDILTPSHMRK